MQASDERRSSVRAPMLVAIVVGLHVVAVGSFLFIQGCGTKQVAVEPPPAPIMPPRQEQAAPVSPAMPKPVFQPPVAVEAAPTSVEAAGGQSYTVASGDSLSKIASRYGVTAREIAELNSIKDPNKIRVGQKLILPAYANEQAPAPHAVKKVEAKPEAKPAAKAASKPAAAAAGEGEYVVKAGDSLSKIAAKQGTTVKALREANNLKSDMIRIGQKLTIPGGKPAAKQAKVEAAPAAAPAPAPSVAAPAAVEATAPAAAPAAAPEMAAPAEPLASADVAFEYTLKTDESLDDVAKKFAVLKQDILTINGITDEATVKAGARLKIPMSNP